MVRVCLKNTFISLSPDQGEEEADEEPCRLRAHSDESPRRERRAGPVCSLLGDRDLDTPQEQAGLQLEKLSRLLDGGGSCSSTTGAPPAAGRSCCTDSCVASFSPREPSPPASSDPVDDEDDRDECGDLGGRFEPPTWSGNWSSCSSVSTVASDHTPGGGPRPRGAKLGHSGPQRVCGLGDSPQYRHRRVPRRAKLDEEVADSAEARLPTTIMIRNIPNRYTQSDLIAELEDLGLAGTFDFLYVPLDTGTMASVGYAFVNFLEPYWAMRCMAEFENYVFRRYQRASCKVAHVSVAHIQGLDANLAHYEAAAVNKAKLKQRRPLVMAHISKVFVPKAGDSSAGQASGNWLLPPPR
mmetsp:Transcript_66950/g.143159  ORF Transcript_66950/g.143159 Transcript_66950/m.143159 type:complete len:354 (-) Transcript_66950:130-1191(-)